MKNNIKAEIISHSKRNNTGDEIITYKLTFPRIILSEVNTYKMLEKNTSSCLSEDTLITLYDEKSRRFFDMEIRKVFKNFINNEVNYKIVSFIEDGSNAGCFIIQNIKTVFSSGVKDIYKVEQNNIYSPLKITDKHRLLTDKGWKTLQDYKSSNNNEIKIKDNLLALTCNEALYNLKKAENNIISTKSLESRFKLLDEISVISVEHIGKDETYDIEVDGEYHNFIANGVVVHNSRAIPFDKMVEVVEKEPFIPIAWQLSHKGMQGIKYITDPRVIGFKEMRWLNARNGAVDYAKSLVNDDVTIKKLLNTSDSNKLSKNYGNRLLEPFMWTTQLITGTRESFEHLFEQRCPIYDVSNEILRLAGSDTETSFKSKKDAIKRFSQLSKKDYLWWLQHNKGQAEIHFMDLAEKMYDALNESVPNELSEDEWHIPFSDRPEFTPEMNLKDKITLSCAMTARTSYTTINDDEILTLEKAENIYNKCKEQGHCFDDKTEILTKRGFKLFKDLTYEDLIFAINTKTGEFCGYEKPTRIIEEKYAGNMYFYEGGSSLSLAITPEHKLLCIPINKESDRNVRGIENIEIHKANEERLFTKRIKHLTVGEQEMYMFSSPKLYNTIQDENKYNLGKLFGFFIGDGSQHSKKVVKFRLKVERKIQYLTELLKDLNIKFNLRIDLKGVTNVTFEYDLSNFCILENDKKRKHIPNFVKDSTDIDLIYGLFDGLKNSDGSILNKNTWVYDTFSEKLSTDIESLCYRIGLKSKILTSYRKKHENHIRITLSENTLIPVNSKHGYNKVEIRNYKGIIYCLEIPSNGILVRRNGKTVITHNSSVFSHIAKCMTYEEYESWYKGFMKTTYYFDENGKQHRIMNSEDFHKAIGYNKNLKGFISLRQYIEDGIELKDI